MFGVTADEGNDESGQLLQDLVDIERELFISLGLHFRSAAVVVVVVDDDVVIVDVTAISVTHALVHLKKTIIRR